jgi:hypothetical protein
VQIKFGRSGGFAGAATNVGGTVRIDEHGATVNGEGTDYHRELTPQEVERLRTDVRAGQTTGSATGAVPDGYQYDITVVTDDGKLHSWTLGEDSGMTDLRSWIQEEAQKIWSHRVSSRK